MKFIIVRFGLYGVLIWMNETMQYNICSPADVHDSDRRATVRSANAAVMVPQWPTLKRENRLNLVEIVFRSKPTRVQLLDLK